MRRIAITVVALLWLVNVSSDAAEQSTPQVVPAFEVATIKPQTGPRPPRGASSPDRFTNPDTTLRNLIEYAYELTDAQVAGGPEWIASRRFAVDAKAVGTPSRAEMRLLVRTLIAQRFNLKTHSETRELPVYLLERVRPDGPLGPALRVSECAAPVVSLGAPREPGSAPSCGVVSGSPVRISARGVAMSQFARNVRDMGAMTGVDRIVTDRTGLAGYYDFELNYRPTETAQLAGGADNPTLFDALREQLGLKLTPARAPVSVLVVDSAELPTPD
jgi:uncharacterized protein (TIGR03435 family)